MKLITPNRLKRIRSIGGRLLALVGLKRLGRRHLAGLSRRMRAREQELQDERDSLPTPWEAALQESRRLAAPRTSGPTILLLNDCSDQDNFGTEALMDGLRVILSQSVPDAHFRSIPSHWVMDQSAFGSAFPGGGKDLRQPTPVFPDVADQFDEIADEWLSGAAGPDVSKYLAKLTGVDLVILNGEGSIYRANLSAVRELFLVWFARTRLGLPVIFANGTVHLTDVLPILPAMVRKAFGVLDAVAVREPFSFRNIRAYAPDIRVRLIPDSAFVHTADLARGGPATAAVQEQLRGQDYFCYDPGPMTIDNRTPGRSAEHLLISELNTIVPQAVLVPTPPVLRHVEEMSRIAEETHSIYAGRLRDYREYMALVRQAQFVVSGRYHDTILAGIMGCPTIPLAAASHKVHGASELLGLGNPYDGTDLRWNMDAIKQRAADCVSNRQTLKDALMAKTEELGAAAWGLGELVETTVKRPGTQALEEEEATAERR